MKKAAVILVLMLLISPLWAGDTEAGLASLFRTPLMPSVCGTFTANPSTGAGAVAALKRALAEDFGAKWTDEHFAPGNRKVLAYLYTEILADLLPCRDAVFSELTLSNGLCSVGVYFPGTGRILTFLLDGESLQIVSINIVR